MKWLIKLDLLRCKLLRISISFHWTFVLKIKWIFSSLLIEKCILRHVEKNRCAVNTVSEYICVILKERLERTFILEATKRTAKMNSRPTYNKSFPWMYLVFNNKHADLGECYWYTLTLPHPLYQPRGK